MLNSCSSRIDNRANACTMEHILTPGFLGVHVPSDLAASKCRAGTPHADWPCHDASASTQAPSIALADLAPSLIDFQSALRPLPSLLPISGHRFHHGKFPALESLEVSAQLLSSPGILLGLEAKAAQSLSESVILGVAIIPAPPAPVRPYT